MKKVLILLLCATTLFVNAQQTSLAGKITDGETGEELIGANISLYKKDIIVTGASTDFKGNYSLNLDPGNYDVTVSYIGYSPTKITDVIIKAGQANKLDVQLGAGGAGVNLDEIVITQYKIPLIQQDNTTQGGTIRAQEMSRLPTKNVGSLATSTAGLSQVKKGDGISMRSSRSNGTDIYVDGIRVNANAVVSTTTSNATPKTEKLPNAGQLTAGEWKDLDNWTFWEKLMKNEIFNKYQDYWGFYPKKRFELKISDPNGQPIANVAVNLLNVADEVVWTSRSDNKGSACLWGNFYGGDNEKFQLEITTPDGTKKMPAIPYSKGLNNVELKMPCTYSNQVDVAFVMDVSGSMSDELRYLRAELSDVINQVEAEDENLELRTAAICYLGRRNPKIPISPLSDDKEKTLEFIKTRNASGGGEEAVNLGLGKAIRELDWNSGAMARIVFILLDEPPAYLEDVKKDMQDVIKEAAKKGIKVIPVASSGTNKPTEFLLKFFAMGTNSTYTFLTNHSGIGGHHIAPEAGSYNVETLNDLMVRLILENSEYATCEEESLSITEIVKKQKINRKTKRSKGHKTFAKQIKCYPNPATDFVNISLEKAIDVLIITSANGQVMGKYPALEAGEIRLQTSDWIAGIYFFYFYDEDGFEIRKVVVESRD